MRLSLAAICFKRTRISEAAFVVANLLTSAINSVTASVSPAENDNNENKLIKESTIACLLPISADLSYMQLAVSKKSGGSTHFGLLSDIAANAIVT